MYTRSILPKFMRALERSPVLLLIGARQTGKTTLVKQLSRERGYTYITFDDIRYLSAAKNDPIGFINSLVKPVILDEVQRVPDIFLPIKKDVDEHRIPGRYILTGSANPLMLPHISDSLAGRMELFTLYPLSQGELEGSTSLFIDALFEGHLPKVVHEKGDHGWRADIASKIVVGGYPNVLTLDEEGRVAWFESYITTIIQRDVQDLARIEGLTQLPDLLHLLATRTGNLLNIAELSRASGISVTTLNRYITLLETLFLVYFQPPWSAHFGLRLVRSPKIQLIDSGLWSFLMNMNAQRLLAEPRLMGGIVENFVVSELMKQISWNTTRVRLYHYRTQAGFEVDIVLEDGRGRLYGIEVKASDTVTSGDFKGLRHLQAQTKEHFLGGVVLYLGSAVVPFEKKLTALPIASLWQTS